MTHYSTGNKRKPALSLKARALALLARRDYTRTELYQKLQVHLNEEQNTETLEQLLDELIQRGWQSDERTAHSRSHSRANRYGVLRLKQEMQRAGIAPQIVQEISENLKESELPRAISLLQRKFHLAATDRLTYAKYYRFLAQKGFNSTTIKQALHQFNEGTEHNIDILFEDI
jgi:regulatory protein